MKKRLVTENQELLKNIRESFSMSKKEVEEIAEKFARIDCANINSIHRHEVDDLMKDLNLMVDPKVGDFLSHEIQTSQIRNFDLKQICDLTCKVKQFIEKLEEENSTTGEYLDAFISLGGNSDKSGYIRKQKLIDTLKNEFELIFDLENFQNLMKADESMNFDDFCQVFESAGEDAKSVITTLSQKVQKVRNYDENDNQILNVRYKDFERWFRKLEQQ